MLHMPPIFIAILYCWNLYASCSPFLQMQPFHRPAEGRLHKWSKFNVYRNNFRSWLYNCTSPLVATLCSSSCGLDSSLRHGGEICSLRGSGVGITLVEKKRKLVNLQFVWRTSRWTELSSCSLLQTCRLAVVHSAPEVNWCMVCGPAVVPLRIQDRALTLKCLTAKWSV